MSQEYKQKMDFFETEKAIKLVKDTFEKKLAENLGLIRVTAPRFLKVGKGLQDDLAGTQIPVSFHTASVPEKIEIVHSLAKWKRYTLSKRGFKIGEGLYTDMDAIRKDEEVDDIHSIYVDQWDWELVISKEERSIDFLQMTVKKIYSVLLDTQNVVKKKFPILKKKLPDDIKFIHTQDLELLYPNIMPLEREYLIARKYGAVFLIGIGAKLISGKSHDVRAADYDDWKLNGDIIVWDSVREKPMELSSMGIRVDKESLVKQLEIMGQSERKQLEFHKGIIDGSIPLSIGGGIGQSRICMLLLEKSHIGEVQSSVWPEEIEKECKEKGVDLL